MPENYVNTSGCGKKKHWGIIGGIAMILNITILLRTINYVVMFNPTEPLHYQFVMSVRYALLNPAGFSSCVVTFKEGINFTGVSGKIMGLFGVV